MGFYSDIPTTPTSPSSPPRRLKNYENFVVSELQKTADNAVAYMTNRINTAARTAGNLDLKSAVDNAAKLSKILVGATFIPAHPSRFIPGAMQQVKNFVFHRPGSTDPKDNKGIVPWVDAQGHMGGCTLLNVVKEFSQLNSGASTHFIIGYGGELIQMVDLADKAKHIGEGRSGAVQNNNAVGVELEGAIQEPMTTQQLDALIKLVCMMSRIYNIPLDKEHLLLHSALSPKTRKDPGPNFPYEAVISACNLRMVSGLVPTSATAFFQPPFDATETYVAQLSSLALDVARADPNPGTQANLKDALDKASGKVRAFAMSTIDRTKLATAAVTHGQKVVNFEMQDLTDKTKMDDLLLATVTPQTAIRGLLYDFKTCMWNDGSQV